MSGSKIVAAAGGFVALLASLRVEVSRVEAAPAQCGLGAAYKIKSVSPYRRPTQTGDYGGTVNPHLRGADVRIAAQPGLTAEWLEHTLQAQFASGSCQAGTDLVYVEVIPDESTFIVRVTSTYEGPGVTRLSERQPDERAAKEILRWAETLPMS